MSEKNWDVIDKKEPRGQSVTYKGIPCTARTCVTYLNRFEKENEQLKQRNNNQYNQLNQLWQLIQAKDWETLTTMDNEMKENDERLKREWKCYE